MIHLFRRKRVVISKTHFVHGETFSPGAMAYSPVATISDPPYNSDVNAARNFHTLALFQPPPVWQGYAIPKGANPGYNYVAADPSGLLALDAAYAKGERIPDNTYG